MNRVIQSIRSSWLKRVVKVVWLTLCKYSETDGEQRAASFAYYAFFAIFPLILLFISIASQFVQQDQATTAIINFLEPYMPLSGEDNIIAETIRATVHGVVKTRGGAGVIAILGLGWSALRFFQALVRGVNKAWGTHEYPWWRLPIKNLAMVGILASALLLGILAPVIMKYIEFYRWQLALTFGAQAMIVVFAALRWFLSALVLFYGLSMFYKFAPRRRTLFSEVWVAALTVTLLLQVVQLLFVLYVQSFAQFNRLYGTFGSVVALLMWIYLSGSVIILGGCLCAAQAEVAGKVQHEVDTKS